MGLRHYQLLARRGPSPRAAAVDKVVFRHRRQGAEVELIGSQAEQTLVDRVGKHDKSHLPAGAGAH